MVLVCGNCIHVLEMKDLSVCATISDVPPTDSGVAVALTARPQDNLLAYPCTDRTGCVQLFGLKDSVSKCKYFPLLYGNILWKYFPLFYGNIFLFFLFCLKDCVSSYQMEIFSSFLCKYFMEIFLWKYFPSFFYFASKTLRVASKWKYFYFMCR